MRTTVTLDPDTEHLIRQRMLDKGVSFKQALNDAIREGASGQRREVYETPVFDMGIPAVDVTKAMRIAGELEDGELIARLRRGA
ncbi:antitoxin [Actinomycetota bacterium]